MDKGDEIMVYINIKTHDGVETIDEFETAKEGYSMLKEYQMVYRGTGYSPYLSSRSTKEWRER